jgi:DNA invertase Pin-like site-specific DNA recombinase
MHRVAIYARENPVTDARGRLDAQVAEVAAFVRPRSWHVATYTDLSSGTRLERPGLAQLVAHARAGWFDVVVVERRDRVATDPTARRQIRDQLATVRVSAVVMHPPLRGRLDRVVATLALVELIETL